MAKTILIVDDDINTRVTLADILTEEGYKIIEAVSGGEALDKVHKENIDLVLMDTRLPDTNGNEVCRQIKKIEGCNVKVAVYTGYIDAVDVSRARAAGADDYIVKTSDFGEILNAIKGLI